MAASVGRSPPPVNAGPSAADRTRASRVPERGEPPRWTRASGHREGVAGSVRCWSPGTSSARRSWTRPCAPSARTRAAVGGWARSSPPSASPTRCRSRAPSPTSSACPSWTWGSMPIADETLAILPRNVALRHGAVPVTLAHDVLTVALADPTNVLALDDIRLATKLASVRTAVATASDVQEAVNRYYGGGAAAGETYGSLADA